MVVGAAFVGTRPLRISSRDGLIRVNGRSFRGVIEVRKNGKGLLLGINELDVEDYLLGVLPAEIPATWEPEALKAQAVASRTFALYQKKTAGKKPYHIRATVLDQLYGGVGAERESTTRAVRETTGIVIVHHGDLIPAFYHSSCGGRTEDAFELWGIDVPYLRGVDCDCQEISKYGVWEKRLAVSEIADALKKMGYRLNGISAVETRDITAAGRVRDLAIRHADGVTYVSAEGLRTAVGASRIPSVFFVTSTSNGDIIFSGRGLGHGVGLCQWGARSLAQRGRTFRSILSSYYPGTTLTMMEDLFR
jgi:stage II sporulation protein D